jgi:hypothetical protein
MNPFTLPTTPMRPFVFFSSGSAAFTARTAPKKFVSSWRR